MFLPRIIKRLMRPLGLASLAVAMHSAPAAADTFTLTTFPTVQSVFHGMSSFEDYFNFSITAPSDVASSAVSINLKLGENYIYRLGTFNMGLYNSLDPLTPLSTSTGNPIEIATSLTSGDYFIKISGTPNGLVGGAYLFSWATAVTPVPEPAEWLMLSIGLLGVGAIARRRRG